VAPAQKGDVGAVLLYQLVHDVLADDPIRVMPKAGGKIGTVIFHVGWVEMALTKKQNLPQKTCATCGRPFTWRKRWAKVWDQVRYCSQACRRRRQARSSTTGT